MGGRGILFVGNDATRTGAPIALLHFLRWHKKNGSRPFSILLGEGGELTGDFETLAETWSTDRSQWCPGGIRATVLSKVGLAWWARRAEVRDVQRFTPQSSPALVYVNSIVSAHAVDMLAPQAPVLTHVHELNSGFQLVAASSAVAPSYADAPIHRLLEHRKGISDSRAWRETGGSRNRLRINSGRAGSTGTDAPAGVPGVAYTRRRLSRRCLRHDKLSQGR